jgi:hypothetical protein
MSTGRRWAALADSLRLVPTDAAWLLKGVVLGYFGYTGWVVVTGGVLYGLSRVLDVTSLAAPLSGAAIGLGALAAVLWLIVPGLAAVWYATREVTNRHGNLEQCYRTPYPLVLVVPPAALLLAGLVAGLVLGAFSTALLAVLAAPAVLLAARVYAYSHRVFSLSVPTLGKAVVFLTAVGLFVGWFAHVVVLAGEQARVAPALEAVGVADLAFGTVALGGYTAVTVPLVVVALPVAAATAYLMVQLVASAVTLARSPSVPSGDVRPGQRVPDRVTVTSPARTPRANGGTSAGVGSATDQDTTSVSESSEGGTDSDASSPADPADGADDSAEEDDEDEMVDSPGDTRVFTPGSGGEQTDTQVFTGSEDDGDDDTKLYAGGDGPDPDRCPECSASLGFDADVAFCPNCGASLTE